MVSSTHGVTGSRSHFSRVVAASITGTAIEFYDFFLYGTASAIVFNKVFFPSHSPLVGSLLAFSTFAIGFIARPVGSLFFGAFGDHRGRKPALMISLMLMGLSTVAIGFLPSAASIGVAAPILLTLCRFLQGFALGGEFGGAVLLISEHSPVHRRGFWASWAQAGGPLGSLLATGVLAIIAALGSAQFFEQIGWRIAFWLSAALIVVAYFLRRAVEDSDVFKEAAASRADSGQRTPMVSLLIKHWKAVLIVLGAALGEKATYYFFGVFSQTYLVVQRGVRRGEVLNILTLGAVFWFASMLAGGWLSDRFGRRHATLIGLVVSIVWTPLGIWLLASRTPTDTLITVVLVGGLIGDGLIAGGMAALFSELFPTEIRYTAASLGYALAGVLGGSLTPMIGTAMLNATGSVMPVVGFVVLTLAISIFCMVVSRETRFRDLGKVVHHDDHPASEKAVDAASTTAPSNSHNPDVIGESL